MQFRAMNGPKKNKLDISTWKRKAHYEFFSKFDQPFWGIATEVNCTKAYNYCKAYGVPFFFYYLYKSLQSANQVKEFRYRIEKDGVVEYETISGSITVLRNDETFGFAYFNYDPDFSLFVQAAKTAIQSEKTGTGLQPNNELNSLIHYSVFTDIRFCGIQHAQMLSIQDSTPKIVFGKISFHNGQVLLPVSVHVNHSLCDGMHVGKFIKFYEQYMELL